MDRSYHGGLVHLSGLRNVGAACEDGEELGLHGRISNIPAEGASIRTHWEGDDYYIEINGEVKETTALGEYVALNRKISTMLGANWIDIEDSIENRSFKPTEHTILYHTNYGFPLIESGAEIVLNAITTVDAAGGPVKKISPIDGPGEPYWFIYYHDVVADSSGRSGYVVCNRTINDGLGVKLSFDKTVLPNLVHWQNFEAGHYVLELGPSNCRQVGGRKTERDQGTLCFLEPWEIKRYNLRFDILTNNKEIDDAIASLPK